MPNQSPKPYVLVSSFWREKLSSMVSIVLSDGFHWKATRPSMRSSVFCDCSAPVCCCHQPTMVWLTASFWVPVQAAVSWHGANLPPSQPETNTRFASVSRLVYSASTSTPNVSSANVSLNRNPPDGCTEPASSCSLAATPAEKRMPGRSNGFG